MKRIIALLMVALMAVSLAACVPTPGDLTDLVNNAIENKVENEIKDEINNSFDIEVETKGDDDVDFDVDDDDNTQETVTVDMGAVTQQVIVDDKGVKITVEDITYEEYYGPRSTSLLRTTPIRTLTFLPV